MGGRSTGAWFAPHALRLAAIVGLIVLFVRAFDYREPQWLIDGAWFGAVLLWGWEVRSFAGAPLLGTRPSRADVLPLLVLLALFVAAWLPFYDNWRWAYTGDSFSLFGSSYYLKVNGLNRNLLSVHGVDNAFTVLWEVTYSWWSLVFGPNFFAHRFGMMVIACLALAAIYTYFTITLGRFWAAVIVVATATNYVWIWFSYVSYLKIDSFVFYFLMLTMLTLTWREPQYAGRWMFCGLIAGLSLFYTPAAWPGIAFMGLSLTVWALATRRFELLLISGLSFVVISVPILIELEWFINMVRGQSGPVLEWDYLYRIFVTILLSPYDSPIERLGVQGAFMRFPFGHTYLAGLGLAALGMLPPVRRRLRLPSVTPYLLGLLLWDSVLMALSNKGYGLPSHKRTYNLIPLQLFFSMLPFLFLYTWTRSRRWLAGVTIALVAVSLVTYATINFRLMIWPAPYVYGTNLWDGLIELRQRFVGRPVVLITSRQIALDSLQPDTLFQVAYGILDHLEIDTSFDAAIVREACRKNALLCYEPNPDEERFQQALEQSGGRFEPFPILNSVQLKCFECVTTT